MQTEDSNIQDEQSKLFGEEDYFLQILVRLVNSGLMNYGITLQIGGMLVSGQVISGDQYFELLADEFVSSMEKNESSASIHSTFYQLGDKYRNARKKEGEPLHGTTYIHLKDCTLLTADGRPSSFKVLWRGRIAQVDGFFIGFLDRPSSPDRRI